MSLINKQAVADRLGYKSTAQIDHLRRAHGLPCIRVGGQIRFDPAAIEAWLRRQPAG